MKLEIVATHVPRVNALVVVVDRHGQNLLRSLLAHDVVVQDASNFMGARDGGETRELVFLLDLLGDDVVADFDTFITDSDCRTGD